MKIKCENCGKLFEKPLKANSKTKYCSRKCLLVQWRLNNKAKLKKYFAEYSAENIQAIRKAKRKWNQSEGGQKLKHAWYLKNKKKVMHNMLTKYRDKMISRKDAKILIKRLGWKKECRLCKSTENVQLHHKDGNALNNHITNLVYLCRKHHYEKHRKA